MNNTKKAGESHLRRITVTALFCAIAFVLTALPFFKFPVVPAAPYLTYDPKDVFIVLGGFIFGPLTSVVISAVVSLIEMVTVSKTALIGFAMNVISSCAFALPAAIIYRKNRSLTGAVVGLVAGSAVTCAVMLLWNWLLVPFYTPNVTREQVAGMLLPVFLPFNAFKTVLNSALTLLLYRPVISALRRARLVTESSGSKKRVVPALLIALVLVFAACAVTWLALNGRI